MINWNVKAKQVLKSELIRKGISNSDLSILLNGIGIAETKASIDSKISRGKFSASFFLQCLSVIGCNKIEIENISDSLAFAEDMDATLNNIKNKN